MDEVELTKHPKLVRFFKSDSTIKRFRALADFSRSASLEQRVQLHSIHYFYVYQALLDTIQYFESQVQQDSSITIDICDTTLVLSLLSDLMNDIAPTLRTKWQARSIVNVISQVLHYSHVFEFRKMGIHILCLFLEIMGADQASKIPGLMNAFSNAINFLPFCSASSEIDVLALFRERSQQFWQRSGFRFAISVDAPSAEQSASLLEKIFAIASHSHDADFWLKLLCSHIFSQVYPEIAFQLDFVPGDFKGFKSPPIMLQQTIVKLLSSQMLAFSDGSGEPISALLMTDKTYFSFCLRIFQVAFSSGCVQAITDVILLFISWVQLEPSNLVVANYSDLIISTTRSGLKWLIEQSFSSSITAQAIVSFVRLVVLSPKPHFSLDSIKVVLEILHDYVLKLLKEGTNSVLCLLISLLLDVFVVIKYYDPTFSLDISEWLEYSETLVSALDWPKKMSTLTREVLEVLEPSDNQSEKLITKTIDDIIDIIDTYLSPKSSVLSFLRAEFVEKVDMNDVFHRVFNVWISFVQLFGNPNEISNSSLSSSVLSAIVTCINIFHEAAIADMPSKREAALQSALSQKSSRVKYVNRSFLPTKDTLMKLFGPWLLQALKQPTPDIVSSFCSLVCLHTKLDSKIAWIPSAYTIYCNILASSNNEVKFALLLNSQTLFHVELPGVILLIRPMLNAVVDVLNIQVNAPLEVRKASMSYIFSVFCYGNHFKDQIIPPSPVYLNYNSTFDISSLTTFSALNSFCCDLLCNHCDSSSEIIRMSLWGLCVMIFDQFAHSPDQKIVNNCLMTILRYATKYERLSLADTALSCLKSLSILASDFYTFDANLLECVIESFLLQANSLIGLINDASSSLNSQSALCIQLLLTVQEWAVSINPSVFGNSQISQSVFHVIELCLHCGVGVHNQSTSQPRITIAEARNSNDSNSPNLSLNAQGFRNLLHISKHVRANTQNVRAPSNSIMAQKAVRDVAEEVLIQLLISINNFPLLPGPDAECSLIEPQKPEKELNFVLFDEILLTISMHPFCSEENTMVRLIFRTVFGIKTWEFVPVSELNEHEDSGPDIPIKELEVHVDPIKTSSPLPKEEVSVKRVNEDPDALSFDLAQSTDTLAQVLDYIQSHFPISENQQDKGEYPGLEEMRLKIESQISCERLLVNRYSTHNKPEVTTSRAPVTSWDFARFLFSHLGILSAFQLDAPWLKLLENCEKLDRSIRLLDQTHCRECHKVGLIYVDCGQEDQNDILRNEKGTEAYERFVDSLGWIADIREHNGFSGGLDKYGGTGWFFPYYADATTEMVFHSTSRMPTNDSDIQQLHKKRQAGNDHVNIIWSQHHRDFLPSTISSQFNDAHIVIYPLSNGLYRIEILRKKEKVPPFGPLLSHMDIPFVILPKLIRITALHANRAVRYATPGYNRPFPTRLEYIKAIIERHSVLQNSGDLLVELLS